MGIRILYHARTDRNFHKWEQEVKLIFSLLFSETHLYDATYQSWTKISLDVIQINVLDWNGSMLQNDREREGERDNGKNEKN